MTGRAGDLPASAARLLALLATPDPDRTGRGSGVNPRDAQLLVSADLAARRSDGRIEITQAGRAHLARRSHADSSIDPFLGQHLDLARRHLDTDVRIDVTIDDSESPLAWLARRKNRDGRPLIEPVQLQAGERLRAQFTRAQLTPRVTSNWSAAVAQGRRADGGAAAIFSEMTVAARQQVRAALDAVGPEFAGLLLDVCCFLKGLESVESERKWPPRSAKIVLQLGLDRLARHYGLGVEARGAARAPIRIWLAPDANFMVGE